MLLNQYVLILDAKDEDCSLKKDLFKETSSVNVLISSSLENGTDLIQRYEPDLILIKDNFNESIPEICSLIRKNINTYRPILFVLSASENIEEKIEILKSGADDFQHTSIDKQELSLRIYAHLRRHIDNLTDQMTGLPATSFSYRILKRNLELESSKHYALIYLDIDNFESYKETYGHIASDKLLQTFIAIIKTSLNENDFFGRVENNNFVIFTSPEKAEKIAIFLTYSFDMVAQKFYTNEDIDRGYLILHGDEKIGRRIPFVSTSIGIVSNKYKKYESIEELVNIAISTHRLAKSKPGSYWVSDRPRLTGSEPSSKAKRKILIIENDAALSYLLITTLEMQGYSAESINSSEQAYEMIDEIKPDLVVFDTSIENANKELEICRQIKKQNANIKIIVSTADCNKEKILDSGVDLYIPKPYELMVLFNWISRFLNYEILY